MDTQVFVCVDLSEGPVLVGRLWTRTRRGRDSATFEYDHGWLRHPDHGFLYAGPDGWRLAPAYDLNPVPTDLKPRILATNIDLDDNSASLELALSVAGYFGLDDHEASAMAAETAVSVMDWRKTAARTGLPAGEIERMASAFEHDDLRAALG